MEKYAVWKKLCLAYFFKSDLIILTDKNSEKRQEKRS